LVDAFYAAKSLAKNDKVTKSKIFISGHSFGGLIARNTASVAIINSLKDVEVKFAGHIPISPECLTQPADMKYDFSPMLIVIGENDQQTPAKNCSNFIKALPPDYPIEVSTLKGGDHNIYDTSVTSMELESWDACGRWVFDDKGSYTLADLDNMQVNNNNFKVLYSKCIKQIKVDERGSERLRSQVEDSIAGFLSKNAIKQ
jgi:dienelactone hydrolase